MLPEIATNGTRPVSVPPPPHFRAIEGKVRNARWNPGFTRAVVGETAAQKGGLRYEGKVQERLAKLLGPTYCASPSLHFVDDTGQRTCVPDGILFQQRQLVVFEIKNQHTPDAWWQLRQLYQPVLLALPGIDYVSCIEVCRTLEPLTPFPEEIELIFDLKSWVTDVREEMGVFHWRL